LNEASRETGGAGERRVALAAPRGAQPKVGDLMWSKRAAILLVACLPSASSLGAQPSAEEIMQALRTATIRSWEERIKPAFGKTLEREYPGLVDAVRLEVVPYSDFNAFADVGRRRIAVPIGFVSGVHTIAHAATLTYYLPGKRPDLEAYVAYAARTYLDATQKAGEPVVPQTFREFAGISSAQNERIFQDPKANYLLESMMVDSLALIFGHELGHIALRHKPSGSIPAAESRRQETAADAFAARLALRAGFSAAAGVTTTYVFFALIDAGGRKSTHPEPRCRIVRILQRSDLETIMNDEAGRAGIERAGRTVPQLREELRELGQGCAPH